MLRYNEIGFAGDKLFDRNELKTNKLCTFNFMPAFSVGTWNLVHTHIFASRHNFGFHCVIMVSKYLANVSGNK